MPNSRWATGIAMIAIGCSANDHATPDPQPGTLGVEVEGNESIAPPAACNVATPPGDVVQQVLLAPSAGGAVVSASAGGEVAFTAPEGQGVTKLDRTFAEIYAYPYGSVVAMDPKGNAFIAGAFSEPTDFGLGMLVPKGNADTFLVELAPDGTVISAMQLGLCGDGVQSIAIDIAGHVAISGSAMGTVIVDRAGKPVRQLPYAGYVAFDLHGNLVIAGAFAGALDLGGGRTLATTGAGDVDGFIVKVDTAGRVVFAVQIGDAPLPFEFGNTVVTAPHAQAIAGVAVGPEDQIAVVGAYRFDIDLFGKHLGVFPDFPSGAAAGAFAVELAADGKLMFALPVSSEINAELPLGGTVMVSPQTPTGIAVGPGTPIAIDSHGDIVISSNTVGDAQGPFAFPQLTKLKGGDAAVMFSIGNETGVSGYGLGVAVTACDDVVWADLENTPSILDRHTIISKRAP